MITPDPYLIGITCGVCSKDIGIMVNHELMDRKEIFDLLEKKGTQILCMDCNQRLELKGFMYALNSRITKLDLEILESLEGLNDYISKLSQRLFSSTDSTSMNALNQISKRSRSLLVQGQLREKLRQVETGIKYSIEGRHDEKTTLLQFIAGRK